MSGGTAYLLDLDPALVNRELVDLEPVRPGDDDVPTLVDLVRRHAEETGSPVAGGLVDAFAVDPSAMLGRVTRVMPRDYRRVLGSARAAAPGAGRGRAGDELLEVSRG
jgi:glutamate synthase (NADPH/NADH) large chain